MEPAARKEGVVREAFRKLCENFVVHVTLNHIAANDNVVVLQFTYHRNDHDWHSEGSFGDYGFNTKDGQAFKPGTDSIKRVEEMVLPKLNRDENIMAILRIAAMLFIQFEKNGAIENKTRM